MTVAEHPIVAFVLILVAQCTVVTGLTLFLAAPQRGAAYREMVLRIGLYCALLCPVLTAGLIASDVHWITISVRETNSPSSPESVPIEAENAPIPVFHPPSQSPPPPIAEAGRTRFVEPEPTAAPIPSTEHSLVARDAPQESTSDSGYAPGWALSAVMLWAAGLFVGLIGICRSSVKLRRILRSARPIDGDRLQAALEQVASTLSFHSPLRVAESSHVNSPVAAGILRTAIVFPQGLLDRISPDELLAILLHEGAHVIRGDHLTLLLERLLAAAFWFHPLVHLLNRCLDRAREEVCDNYVLQSVDAASYGEALLRLMQLSTDNTQAVLAVGLFPTRWRLEERISGLLNEGRNTMVTTRKTSNAFVAGALALCALAVGTARVTAQTQTTSADRDDTPAKSEEPAPRTATDKSIEIPAEPAAEDAGFSPKNRTQDLPTESTLEVPLLAVPASRYQGIPTYGDSAFTTDATLARTANRHARIASVDMGRLFRSSTKFQRRIKALKQKIEESEQRREVLLKELKSLQVALAAIPKDNEEARAALQKVIENNKVELQQSKDEAVTAFKNEEAEIYLDINREAHHAIRMYADYYKIELVLRMDGKTSTKTDHAVDAIAEPGGIETTSKEDVLEQINRLVIYAPGLDPNAGNIDDITDVIVDYLNKRDQRDKKLEKEATIAN